jgi:hypothetical protein
LAHRFGDSLARTSIATLVYSLARRKDLPEFKSTLGYLTKGLEQLPSADQDRIRNAPEDQRPALIARCLTEGDVQAAVRDACGEHPAVAQVAPRYSAQDLIGGVEGPAFILP